MQQTETPGSTGMDFRVYLAIIRKWFWLVVLCTLLAGGTAYVSNRLATPAYQARTRLLINESAAAKSSDYNAILSGERQARTYAQMLTNRPLMISVIDELELNLTPEKLANNVNAELVRDTRLIDITVENSDPQRAADIANLIAEKFIVQIDTLENARYEDSKANLVAQIESIDEQIKSVTADISALGKSSNTAERDRLETSLAQYRQTYASLVQSYEQIRTTEAAGTSNVAQFEPAVADNVPVRPKITLNTALGAGAGMLLGLVAVFLIEVLDDTIRTPGDVTRQLGLPVLGMIPLYKNEEQKPISASQPLSPVSNAYRILRANIHFASVDRPINKLLVTSSNPMEGKTELVTNLGVVLAQNDLQTIILDTDFRRPAVHSRLGLTNHDGLANLFLEDNPAGQNFQTVDVPNLRVITSGKLPPNPTELLGSEKMGRIIDTLATQNDMLLIDTPPMLAVADAVILSPRVDGILLVIKPGVTRIAAARQVIEQLNRAKANLLGVVMNGMDVRRHGYYDGYYAYSQAYNNSERKLRWPRLKSSRKSV